MRLSSKSVLAIIAAGALSLPTIAMADIKTSHVNKNQVVIAYDIADLNTPKGRASLEREIRGAADQVCGTRNYHKDRSLAQAAKARSCYHDAVAEAISGLGSIPLLVTAR